MNRSLPPLTWIRAFESAARHLSFTAAAEELGMTQSAVSQQVKALETRLRIPLFTRRARGLSLTDGGRQLLPQVGAALEQLSGAIEGIDAGPKENQLIVAASVSVTQWVIAPHLHEFLAAHPQTRVRFLSAIWPDDFLSARADVEIRFGSAKQVGRAATRLEPSQLITLKSTKLDQPFDTLPRIEAVGTSGGWRAWGDAYGNPAAPSLFADSYGMALHLAMQGLGVALVSALLARDAVQSGQLMRAHPGSLNAQEGYWLSVNESHPSALLFRDWLLTKIQSSHALD